MHLKDTRSLHPATALAAALWGVTAAYMGSRASPIALGLALAIASPMARRLLLLYAWLAAPVAFIVGLLRGYAAAVDSVLGVLAVAVPFSSALSLVPPRWLARALWTVGLPPTAAYFPVFTLRLADHLGVAAREAVHALRGRGVAGGFRLALRAPVPVVVQGFQSAAMLAEALYFKAPRRGKTWVEKPRIGGLDYVIWAFLAAWLAGKLYLDLPPIV